MADVGKCSIQKLANDNYAIWKFEMEMALETMDLWYVVEDDAPEPVTAAWKKADRKARAHIALSIDRSQYPLIKSCATAKDVWDALKAHHEKQTVETQLSLLCRLCDAKMEERGDVEKHLLAMDALFERVEDAGFALAEKLRIAMLLRSIPRSYHFLASALQVRKDSEITMSLVKSVLTNEYMMRVGRGDSAQGEERYQQHEEKGLAAQKLIKKCYFCKKPGHFKADCVKFQQWKVQHEDGEGSGSKQPKNKSGARAKQAKEDNGGAVSFSAKVVEEEACASVKHGHFWTIDSGASCHMTSRKEFFTSLEDSNVAVVMADGNSSKASGTGCGTVIGVNGAGGPKEINLNNVLYVPKLENGLLSVGKIAEKGFKVLFTRDSVEIIDGADEVVALGERSGGVYVLKESGEVAAAAEERCHTLNCQHTWHRRLGHRDVAVLDQMKKGDLVSGVKIVDCGVRRVCAECLEGKSARLPFPQMSAKKTTKPLQLVHTDLCGPMRNVTPGGNRYFMCIIDDYSRFLTLYLLKDKAEAKDCIRNYVRMAENQFGRKPAIIRSDRGGEFVNKELARFYREEGIEAQLTAGYSPQQNGVAERRNRYINDMAVCMLLESGLHKRYWGEAIATAAYIQNRTPSRVVPKTPYELWYGQKPDLSHLRVFGCEAFVHIPSEKRGKLEGKAEKLTFVGYDCKAKAYRFLDKKSGKISISRDARFIEIGEGLQEEPRLTATHEVKRPRTSAPDDSSVADEDETRSLDEEPSFEGFFDESLFEGEEPAQPMPRRTQRSNAGQQPRRMEDFVVGVAKLEEKEPNNYKEAINSSDKDKWRKAMDEEYESLLSNDTWTLVPLPPGRQAIGSKWVYKQKRDSAGQVVRYKARLVAQGYAQRYGVDFNEVFAPVAMQQTFRVLLTVASHRKLRVWHIDVKNAYLNGKMDEEQYMRQPPGYAVAGKEALVCKLNRCLYGLKQAARVWNTTVKRILLGLRFRQSASDACLFLKQLETGEWIYLLIYVDDMIVVCKDRKHIAQLEEELKKEFEISSLGEVSQFLGIKVNKDETGFYSISQRALIRDIAARFGLDGAKGSQLPLDVGYYKLNSETLADKEQYHSLVGALLYVAMNSRPDVAAAVSILSRKTSCPRECDWSELKRVVRYLIATEDYELKLGRKVDELTLVGFSDADWSGDTTDRKSTSGFVFELGGAAVSWGSRKQNCVATSTMEAEYVALSEAAQEAVWLRRLLSELGEKQVKPTVMNEDNRSCIDFVSQDRQNKRSKHIDTKFYHAKDLVAEGVIQLRYCPTDSMLADVFTKPLGPAKVKQFAAELGLIRKT